MASRRLTGPETQEARLVFGNSLNYKWIFILDNLGVGNRPFTHRGGPDVRDSSLNGVAYTMHMGPAAYEGILWSATLSAILIHELTHVWQGQHGIAFEINSISSQAGALLCKGSTTAAYEYDKTNYKKWNDYNVEQQAEIVEDWYKGGRKEDDPRWPYILRHIRGETGIATVAD